MALQIEAIYVEGKLIVSSSEAVSSLEQRGYGTKEEKTGLILSPTEALYLLGDKKLRVVDKDSGIEQDFPTLLGKIRTIDPEIWIRYLIYRDLRDRGYVVREGFGLGVDFRVYERGQYGEEAAKYIVFGISEGTPIPVGKIVELLRYVQSLKRELVLAVIDRRGEIVYYSVSQLTF
ncbi:tRNA-intron lyase [Candidatus Bathyarchaeota archaeon]|nr:tRNA-intron lyase [Candidatus Bathyarchaeota archaeon]